MDGVRLDHLALALRTRSDGFATFLGRLSGRWLYEADAGAYRMCQIEYADGMRIELLDPSSEPEGFLPRFLGRSGPGPHHVTFKVDDIAVFRRRAAGLGIPLMAGRDTDAWKESFVHPKVSGLGTVLQAAQADETRLGGVASPKPTDAPAPAGRTAELLWVGLLNADVDRADGLLADLFGGELVEDGIGPQGRWRRRSWAGRDIVFLQAPEESGLQEAVGGRNAGVHHVAFAADDREPGLVPPDHHTGVSLLLEDPERSWLHGPSSWTSTAASGAIRPEHP